MLTHLPSHPPIRRASALLTVVVLLIALGGMAVVMTKITVMGVQEHGKRYEQVGILLAAESAMNAAISDLQQNYDDRITVQMPNDGDTYDVNLAATAYQADELNGATCEAVITRLNTDSSDPDLITFLIQGTATVGDPSDPQRYRRTRVECTVAPAPQEIFKQAMFALEGYDFQGAATTDSWNSDSSASGGGDYGDAGTTITGNGDLSSEGDIDVQNTSNVGGEVIDNQEFPLPVFDYEDQVSGLAYTGTDLDDAWVSTNGTTSGGTSTYSFTTGAYRFETLTLGGNSVIEVDGDVELYIDGQIDWGKAGMSYVNSPNSSLRIYQGDYPESDGDTNWSIQSTTLGDLTESGGVYDAHPENLIVLSNYSGYSKMNGNGEFCGVFFAPDATMHFNGTFDFFGSVISRRYDTGTSGGDEQGKVNGTFNFHYDDNLASLDLDLTARLLMQAWRSYKLSYAYSD